MALARLHSSDEIAQAPLVIASHEIDESSPPFLPSMGLEARARQRASCSPSQNAVLSSSPCHPSPLYDELLSSWLLRLAAANHCKLHTFCTQLLPGGFSMWARDIDRSATGQLIQAVAKLTALPEDVVRRTTLRELESSVVPRTNARAQSRFFLMQGIYHRTRRLRGIMYCPACLAGDELPYFRRCWRITLVTVCSAHKRLLSDCCPVCNAPVSFFRQELGHRALEGFKSMCFCHKCMYDLRTTVQEPISSEDARPLLLEHLHTALTNAVSLGHEFAMPMGATLMEYLVVVRRLAQYMTSANRAKALRRFREQVEQQVGICAGCLPLKGKFSFLPLYQRHVAVSLALWLLDDWPTNLIRCGDAVGLRSSDLLRDFADAPVWYRDQILVRYYHPVVF